MGLATGDFAPKLALRRMESASLSEFDTWCAGPVRAFANPARGGQIAWYFAFARDLSRNSAAIEAIRRLLPIGSPHLLEFNMTTRNPETILRTYGFWILSSLRDECREFLEANTLKELIESPGNLRSTALFRDQADGTVEVVILALWDSMESVKTFLGKQDLRKPRIDPSVHGKIFDREPYVRQYALSDPDALALIPPSWR